MAVIWAVNFSVVKFATTVFTPLAFAGIRVMLAAAVLLAFAAVRKAPWPTRKEILGIMLLGVVGNGIYQLLFVEGIARTRVANAALIVAATPAIIAIMNRISGAEHVRRRVLGGIALSLAGVAFVVLGSSRAGQRDPTFLGSLLVFTGTLCWATFTIFLQPYARRIDPIQLSALTMLGGSVPLVIMTSRAIVATDWSAIGIAGWGAVFYASVISMGIASIFWYRGLRVLGATRTAVYGNLQPVIAMAVAWIFLSEVPTTWQAVGTLTIMSGLYMTRS